MRPKGVADGHAVNIPRLPYVRCGDAALSLSLAMVSSDRGYEIRIGKSAGSFCQEKPLRISVRHPYHKPTQVDE